MIRTIFILTLIVMAIAYFFKESNTTDNTNIQRKIYCVYKKIKMFIERNKRAPMSKSHSQDKNPGVIRQIEAEKANYSEDKKKEKQQDYNSGLYEEISRKLHAVSKILEGGYDKR